MFSLLLPRSGFSIEPAAPLRLRALGGRVGRELFALCSLVALLALAGCAGVDNAGIQSEREAQQAALSAQLDAAISRVNKQPRWSSSLDDRASFASFNTDAVSVSYQGSAADLLQAVASSRGKGFKVTGPTPRVPIFVFVETKDQPFIDFLKDLDKQLGQRADVVWTDVGFELRYR